MEVWEDYIAAPLLTALYLSIDSPVGGGVEVLQVWTVVESPPQTESQGNNHCE